MRITKLLCLTAIPFFSQIAFANTTGIPSGNITIGIDIISDSGDRTFHIHPENADSAKVDLSGDASGVRVRLQTKIDKNNAVELYFLSYDADAEFETNGGNAYDFGVTLVISRNLGAFVPFGKLGAGIGFAPIEYASEDNDFLANVHAGIALGVKFALTTNVSVIGSFEATYRAWESVTFNGNEENRIDIADDILRTSLGIEYSF